jgi:hypothetical protein
VKDSKIFDINNFIVHQTNLKINEKKEFLNIPIPVYKRIEVNYDDYLNNIDYNNEEVYL